MSSEGDTRGQPSATTISTVAVQAGDSRLVVAVLKCGPLLQLQLAESTPNLLEIGSNQDETKKHLDEHEQLLTNLKKHEHGVWGLLSEADKVAQNKKNEVDVHVAMASTLSDAWRTLIAQLEKRRSLLNLASDFFDRALEFAIKIDEAEDFQHSVQGFTGADCLKEVLHKHSCIKKGLLENSMLVLNKSQELFDFLKEFQEDKALVNQEKFLGAHRSCEKVESLMEILQDRRRQVDRNMKRQGLDLEMMHHIYQWDQQEQEATNWYKNNAEVFLEKDQLGSTLSENEELLQEYKNFELKAKDWSLLVEKLLVEASEILASEGHTEKGHVEERTQKLKALHEEFWNQMMVRRAHLQESKGFFTSANKAFEVLAGIESSLKGMRSQVLSLPELAKKHEELLWSIKEAAAEPLQQGKHFLNKVNPRSTQVGGVERMMGYIHDRMDSLSKECHAHRELAEKRQLLVSSFEDLVDKVSAWIKSSSSALSGSVDPGLVLSESEDVLNRHLELSSQTQGVANELEAISELIKALKSLESPEAIEFSNKASLLSEELKTLTRNITARTESLKPYVSFLRSAEEVDEQIRSLQECYKNRPEAENEESNAALKEVADAKWQALLERFLIVQDLGNNFINSSNMVSGNLTLNVKSAVRVVENTLDDLNKKKANLMDLWTSWQLHISQIKSVKKQWKKFKEQLKKTVHNLKALEDVLAPASSVDLGSDLLTVSKLQETFNLAKPQFVKLNAEVEYMIKISEMLALKGIPIKEKNEKITELLHLHQRVKDTIKEYERVLSMAVKFHHLFDELENLLTSEPVTAFHNTSQAKIQLAQHQERQSHVRHLYKMAISLGADITSTVMQSHALGFTAHRLQDKLERLERGSSNWSTEADKCEESLVSNVHYCIFKEEINELRESFKDLKKKFNNLKFNYMKKNDKTRNVKAVKNQIQQIEIFVEKLQVLKKKMQAFTVKISASTEKHLKGSSPREIEDAVNELQRQLGDFDKVVEEYKHNLDMTVKLQLAMEEYQFWCDDASATIVRVGKYSSECKTREAVSSLYKQFEKFVWPTVPQQEERINQITELAVRLHGPEEGKKFVEKTVAKHNEIVESIKELCNGLMDLEVKLQEEALKEQSDRKEHDGELTSEESRYTTEGTETSKESTEMESEQKESGHTPENDVIGNEKEVPVKKSIKKFNLCKTKGQNLPEKLHPENHIMSESSSQTQQEYSEVSAFKTITSRSTVETTEQLYTSYSHTQTFNISCSPVEKNTKIHVLYQTENEPQATPPPAPSFSDIQREFQRKGSTQKTTHEKVQAFSGLQVPSTDTQGAVQYSTGENLSQEASDVLLPPGDGGGLAEGELFIEESLSNDEYECTSPDDISLPPLSETPESNIIQSENDLDDGFCLSSHSLHVNQYSQQSHSQLNDTTVFDTAQQRRDWVSTQSEDFPSPTGVLGAKFRAESSSFVRSPLTVPTPSLVSNTLSSILKSKPTPSLPPGTHSKCHQTVYAVHESFTETQECVHDPSQGRGASAQADNMHVTPSPLTAEQDPDICKPTAVREEIRLMSGSRASGSLADQGPNFSKLLSNATVMEGSPVTLEVEVTGFPEPTLTWYRNGQKVTNDERIELSHKEGKHALFIQMVTDTDAGLYVVQAINSSGSLSSSAVLQVKGNSCPSVAPTFKLDWLTCFGTLCVLLWLLYLLVL
ncbi:coiled-coil domain-containing protein 141 isoform X1 [Anguilla anguilla]|uniref:coiled-coil domain-containing protein 141 isoform X1 n=1 Tax=Anguilla anguilla TaxID=7936 RepID=UPI0015B1FEC5|nr:coiled-coil domain-containing protein 141 isoform X1 [Anguilla anguilla]